MSLSDILTAIGDIIAHLVGGTPSGATSAISFSNSWVGSFLATITTSNGWFFIAFGLSICLFGLHVLKSLMNR